MDKTHSASVASSARPGSQSPKPIALIDRHYLTVLAVLIARNDRYIVGSLAVGFVAVVSDQVALHRDKILLADDVGEIGVEDSTEGRLFPVVAAVGIKGERVPEVRHNCEHTVLVLVENFPLEALKGELLTDT